jgi:hypothetical protein
MPTINILSIVLNVASVAFNIASVVTHRKWCAVLCRYLCVAGCTACVCGLIASCG